MDSWEGLMKKKNITILIGAIVLLIVISFVLYWMNKSDPYDINPSEVANIQVKMEGSFPQGDYCEKPKFVIESPKNIEHVIHTLQSEQKRKKYEDYVSASVKYEFTFHFVNGTQKEYSLQGFMTSEENRMEEVLSSEEVVKQIRSAYIIHSEDIEKVQYYYWKDKEAESAPTIEITDSSVINTILEVAKKDVLARPRESLDNTDCGFVFYNKDGDMILTVQVSKKMKGYDQLLKVMPSIQEYT